MFQEVFVKHKMLHRNFAVTDCRWKLYTMSVHDTSASDVLISNQHKPMYGYVGSPATKVFCLPNIGY